MMQVYKNSGGLPVLLKMVSAIQDNKAYLGDVDGLIGDGDHGMNMNKGFSVFAERFGKRPISFSDGLFELGMILLNEIGGSMGPIYGTIFTETAEQIRAENTDELDLADFASALEAGLAGLLELVDARPGDKTLVDTLTPAVQSLQADVRTDASFSEALAHMKAAAIAGMESTKPMLAKYGRSSRLGERSRGVLDAGSVSCCLLLCAIADGITEQLTIRGDEP